ncbi:hypothetical protein NSK_000368 [Nannochloropsis salina CCMP1776]|uniref:tRNA methyltransferase 112 homolog n=1 Tax=Nannochloropsis salina CCMP1776 TaxID=1027361 RepID=A0A4D9DAH9_9STRA|nr:hypothetical protein NSK_000368 [Nannochloropsis salina CCMP1776]|eukprot:TFJ88014.1 hypothetical protein NSK_000368 [Nannochloropsis salina CCMP1776]
MRLLSHNVLRNTAKGVVDGYPLKIEAAEIDVRDTEPDLTFIRHLLPTISFSGLRSAAEDLGLDAAAFPASYSTTLGEDEAFLRALHKALFDVRVLEGSLVCPESGRRFSIRGGIPDMMLTDEELS